VISRLRERLPSFSDDNTPVGEKSIRDDGIGRASRRESVGALSAGGDQRQAVESAQMPSAQEPQGLRESHKATKPVRRNQKYKTIDQALQEIAESRPSSQEEILQSL